MLARLLIAVFAIIVIATPTLAKKRFALLIGNSAYPSTIGKLKNPKNDVTVVAQALKQVGFKTEVVEDAGLGRIQFALNRHIRRLRRAGRGAVGFLYYSGHGAADQLTKVNYLIPVDAQANNSVELWDSSLPLYQIKQSLSQQAANADHFIIFDACRNELRLIDPDTKSLVQSKGFRS